MRKVLKPVERYARVTWTSSTLTVALEPLEQVVEEWAMLARALPRPLPFDHPAWHIAWWSHFGGDRIPLYLALRDGGRLRGIVPLMRDGETLAVATDPNLCDYTAFPIMAEAPDGVLAEVFAAVDALPWRTFHIWGLPEEAAALMAAIRWGEARGYGTEMDFEAVCPRIALPGDWEAYLACLSKKDRHELRRKMRRFASAGSEVGVQVFCTPAEVDAALGAFFHLHRISRHTKAEFMTPAMEAFFRDMALGLAAEGIVRLFQVELDARPVASLLAFVSGDELLLYNSGYDPSYAHASVGLVSKALTLQHAIADGLRTYDFLRGAEPYKYDLGATDRIVRQVWIRRDA